MSITVVLGVGLDPWLLASCDVVWRSAGFIVIPVACMQEAIEQFQAGDFDLVLVGEAISNESKERLTFLVRASGAQTPVISIAGLSGDRHFVAESTPGSVSERLLATMNQLLAGRDRTPQKPERRQNIAAGRML